MKEKKDLIKNTLIVSIGKFSTRIVSFLLLPLYTTLLSKAEYGSYDLLNTLSIFLVPLIMLHLEEGMFRFLIDAKNAKDKGKIFMQTYIYISISFVVWSLLILLVSFIIDYSYGLWLIGYLFASVLFNLVTSFFRGIGNFKTFSLLSFINSLINILLNIIFIAVFKMGLIGLFLSYIISCIVVGLVGLFKSGIYKYLNYKLYDKNMLKEMIRFSLPLVPNNISWHAINLTDRLLITNILGVATNGIYSIANWFPTIISTCYSFFNVSWRESASKMVSNEKHDDFYNSVYLNLKHFLITISILVIAFLPFVFNILVNKNFKNAYFYIPLMILSTYYSNLSNFSSGIFAAYKDNRILAPTTLVAAIINLLIGIIFINKLGLFAPILGTLVAYFLINIYRNYKLKKYITLSYDKYNILSLFIFIIITLIYYSKNIYLELGGLIISFWYFYYLNKSLIKSILKRKIKKESEVHE